MENPPPYPHQNTVVIVGDKFDPGVFGDLNPFGIPPDPQNRVVMGPFAQITYGNGAYAFNVQPNRVSLHMNSSEIFPEPLLNAAVGVTQRIDALRPALVVVGLGLNCDAILPVPGSGYEYCRRMVQQADPSPLGPDTRVASLVVQDLVEGVQYTRKFEPAAQTQGQDLFLAVNAHQDLSQQTVTEALRHVPKFREQVGMIHEAID